MKNQQARTGSDPRIDVDSYGGIDEHPPACSCFCAEECCLPVSAADRRRQLQDSLSDGQIDAACVLATGPEPGLEVITGLPFLLVGMLIGNSIVVLVLLLLAGCAVLARRQSVTAIVSNGDLLVFRNSRLNGGKPVLGSEQPALPLDQVSLRVLKSSTTTINVLLNGEKYWAGPRDVSDMRKLIDVIDAAQ